MNAGLGNLTELKARLLAEALRGSTDYDNALIALGQGVAALFEKECNRKLMRLENDRCEFSMDRNHYYLPRYPVESIALVEERDTLQGDYVVSPDMLQQQQNDTGYIWFGGVIGMYWMRLRVTYTGGYWWETLEPTDEGYPSAMPDGATPLPNDLKLAWYLQCEHVWAHMDKLGLGLAEKPGEQSSLTEITLIPAVKEILNGYIRYQIS